MLALFIFLTIMIYHRPYHHHLLLHVAQICVELSPTRVGPVFCVCARIVSCHVNTRTWTNELSWSIMGSTRQAITTMSHDSRGQASLGTTVDEC